MSSHHRFFLDWDQWLYPGPRRVFSAEEMARAGSQPWPTGIDHYAYVNLILLLAIYGSHSAGWTWPLVLGLGWATLAVARWLWRQPTRKRLNVACYAVLSLIFVMAMGLARSGWREQVLDGMPMLLAILTAVLSGWWILTLYRVEQIEARLRELAEQEAALKLSTRLAAAQIQPHFMFNTLASLQHWVDTGDARAAPLLRDFTAYLRATLPMFERELQPLADEIEMVRRYLAIMQARLGARLAFNIDVPADLDVELPPGLVLTLVENAIAHGIEPQLRGGHLDIAAREEAGRLVLTISDDGPGLAAGWAEGVGLSNTRRRLAAAFPHATLTLADAHPGCIATLTL
ncbi:sensor histidine kinase YesM [Pelomonas saccharophila]|uniref:Sensor histidine kinase YesM n=1 Tax=Roseateles saccharophilus TaxID=304 RepID=A0ABU1YXH6_ROSSA|nr:histidine kinase [Roseateles saccharophilus]MDR7272961.1 sensor histidine kinase YesM [Roseateles saccharophilus]